MTSSEPALPPDPTPAALTEEEWATLSTASDRVGRALLWLVVFTMLGLTGMALRFGAGDEWLPLLGVGLVLGGILAFLWVTARCPRCGTRPLLFRRSLPDRCPRCGVPFAGPLSRT